MPKYVATKTQTEPLGKLGHHQDKSKGTDALSQIKSSEYISQHEDSPQPRQLTQEVETPHLEEVQESQREYDSVSQITGNKNID